MLWMDIDDISKVAGRRLKTIRQGCIWGQPLADDVQAAPVSYESGAAGGM